MAEQALTVIGQGRQASVLPSSNDWNTMMQMAETLYRSGVLPEHIKNAAAVVAIVQKGKELGVPPMHALQNIAFIKGKTTLQAELMLALVIRDVGVSALRITETDNTHCTVRYTRPGNEGDYTFTIEDAKQAQLLSSPSQMYQKYPAAMLRSRCISAVCRFVFPDIIGGMYTPEELGAVMDEEGNTLALPDQEPMRATIESPPAPQRPAGPPASTLPQTRRTARVLGSLNPETATVGDVVDAVADKSVLLKKLWPLAVAYYGDKEKADAALHEWVKVGYPDAQKDGKPSLRALTADEMQEIITAIESAPLDAEISEEPAAE